MENNYAETFCLKQIYLLYPILQTFVPVINS